MSTPNDRPRPPVAVQTRGRREVIPGISTPKAFFIAAAGLSFLMSVYLFFTGDHERGIFVGIWVPSILSLGTLLMGRDEL